jgi:hypothetical protein
VIFLKAGVVTEVAIGPFLDDTDGKTAETGLTISASDIRLKIGAANWAAATNAATHEELGWYRVDIASAEAVVGPIILSVQESGALPVWHEFMVIDADVYDAWINDSGTGIRANVQAMAANVVTAAAIATDAIDNDAVAANAVTEIAAPILAVLGALADAAADGDPTSADTVMMYVKQLVNTLVGTAGIPTFPASAVPANAVSLAEAIRQVYDEVAGLNGGALPAAAPTAAAVADQVWDEVHSGHLTAGSTGAALSAASAADLLPDASEIADAVLDEVVEGAYTARQLLRLYNAVLLAKLSGAATSTNTFRDVGDTKNRVTATVDADGNRTAVTLDAS